MRSFNHARALSTISLAHIAGLAHALMTGARVVCGRAVWVNADFAHVGTSIAAGPATEMVLMTAAGLTVATTAAAGTAMAAMARATVIATMEAATGTAAVGSRRRMITRAAAAAGEPVLAARRQVSR